ncbi:MAG: 2-C-methyl-D-erythritol 4-phosphate cytidylyltransferase [Deltaproteobacteria bacterium]|nr:2-C-methyl-D-erythritol 4-phosphate cytidylyltransferase [Deltaproteobacteria bacterium]
MKIAVVIPAAGMGRRMGTSQPKQYLALAGRPLICHTLERFKTCESVVVVVEPERVELFRREILGTHDFPREWHVVAGGPERQDSVRNGLEYVPNTCDVILVHDGVRPLITFALIQTVTHKAFDAGAAIVAIPTRDTIKRGVEGFVSETIDRTHLWQAQTPQAFRADIIKKAFAAAYRDNFSGTDEASLVERIGVPIALVQGSDWNIKITTPEDLIIAESLVKQFPLLCKEGSGEVER